MKIKYKLSMMSIATTVIVAVAIISVMIISSRPMLIDLTLNTMTALADGEADSLKGEMEGYLRALRSVASVMELYETIPAEDRRDRYDLMAKTMLESDEAFFGVGAVWKPNALDNMDSQMVSRTGSTGTGQYVSLFARELPGGGINHRAASEAAVNLTMRHMSAPNARLDWIDTPETRNVLGNDILMVRIGVPIRSLETGEVLGIFFTLFDLTLVQESIMSEMAHHSDVAALSIYTNEGFIVAHSRPGNIGYTLGQVPHSFGDRLPDVRQAISRGENLSLQGRMEDTNSNIEIYLSPFFIGNSGVSWAVTIAKAENVVLAPLWKMITVALIAAAVLNTIGAAVIFIVLQRVTAPILLMKEALRYISEGDMTQNVEIKTNDEIGDLGRYLSEAVVKIRRLISDITKETAVLTEVGSTLASNMDETAAAINQIASNVQSISGRITNQSASVTETTATMEMFLANIDNLDKNIAKQDSNVAGTSSAIEEMAANIRSVTETLVKNGNNVKALIESSDVGRAGLSEVVEDIQVIARESEGLMEINAVMENIASQTNLLSMNAAIEAAHAGEAGRGFAVVADEIRKLAESSSEQSKTIGTVLKKMKSSVDKITSSTGDVLDKFEAIDKGVKIVAQEEDNILRAMEEQEVGAKQIVDGVIEVTEISRQVRSGSEEMLGGAKEVLTESRSLESTTQEISMGMKEMADGTNHINTAVNQVNDISHKNREVINILVAGVKRFKVE